MNCRFGAVAALLLLGACAPSSSTDGHRLPSNAEQAALQPVGMYRLTDQQYRNAIRDIFGPDIDVGGRFDPLMRRAHGLMAPGSYQISVSPAGMEQYAQMAHSIAEQVVDPSHRAVLVKCEPVNPKGADDKCARAFFSDVGPLLLRRSWGEQEVTAYVAHARNAAKIKGDFYAGLAASLEGMLVSPRFIFQADMAAPNPAQPGTLRLDGYSRAARLSLFLWNTTPDAALLDAAERGELYAQAGLEKQIDRMLNSPRLHDGVRAFFADMLRFEALESLTKDSVVFPRFILEVRKDMPEQTLRTITHLLLTEQQDYREIFTTRKTFVTRALGALYEVPVAKSQGWMLAEFPAESQRAGILTQINFLAAFSHNGRSSPTLRGQAIRELLLCQAVPEPPGNVDFAAFEDAQGNVKTARERLELHSSTPACAGCHKITDPMGLALEKFDGIGVYRASENGAEIDTKGMVDGKQIEGAVGVGEAISRNPAATSCVVNRLVEYGKRQRPHPRDREWTKSIEVQFKASGYRFPPLLRTIAASETFFSITANE